MAAPVCRRCRRDSGPLEGTSNSYPWNVHNTNPPDVLRLFKEGSRDMDSLLQQQSCGHPSYQWGCRGNSSNFPGLSLIPFSTLSQLHHPSFCTSFSLAEQPGPSSLGQQHAVLQVLLSHPCIAAASGLDIGFL